MLKLKINPLSPSIEGRRRKDVRTNKRRQDDSQSGALSSKAEDAKDEKELIPRE